MTGFKETILKFLEPQTIRENKSNFFMALNVQNMYLAK